MACSMRLPARWVGGSCGGLPTTGRNDRVNKTAATMITTALMPPMISRQPPAGLSRTRNRPAGRASSGRRCPVHLGQLAPRQAGQSVDVGGPNVERGDLGVGR